MRAKFKVIGIRSMEEALADAGKVMEALSRGEEVKEKTSGYFFTSFEAFRRVMTPQRYALLKLIREAAPESVQDLAKLAGRDMKNVSEDLKALLEMDLVEMEKHGKAKAPRVRYTGIRVELAV